MRVKSSSTALSTSSSRRCLSSAREMSKSYLTDSHFSKRLIDYRRRRSSSCDSSANGSVDVCENTTFHNATAQWSPLQHRHSLKSFVVRGLRTFSILSKAVIVFITFHIKMFSSSHFEKQNFIVWCLLNTGRDQSQATAKKGWKLIFAHFHETQKGRWEKVEKHLPTPPMTEFESNFAFFVAKSWLLLSAAGAMTAVWLNNSSLPLCWMMMVVVMVGVSKWWW